MTINVVVDFGAKHNAVDDDTTAFQDALNAAAQNGETVFVPASTYRIDGNLRVPAHVTLEGEWRAPPRWERWTPQPGTVLNVHGGRGERDGAAFITLAGNNAGVKGLAIFYPEQGVDLLRDGGISPYPPAIRGGEPTPNNDPFDNLTVQDCLLLNPYSGVDFARHRCGRHLIRGLYGQPLKEGIQIDGCLDVGRIEDVHFWPFWKDEDYIKEFTGREGFGIILRRSDWQIGHNIVLLGYHVSILFGHGVHVIPPWIMMRSATV